VSNVAKQVSRQTLISQAKRLQLLQTTRKPEGESAQEWCVQGACAPMLRTETTLERLLALSH
jgi:hypothetical protein